MEIQSYHIFLFPFRWDYKKDNRELRDIKWSERVDIDEIIKVFESNKIWQRDQLSFNSPEEFNSSGYFYEFVDDAIFDEKNDSRESKQNEKIVYSYKLKLDNQKSSSYVIDILKSDPVDEKKTISLHYELLVEHIRLNIYNTGIAILSFHLTNINYSSHEDILRINDYGRRIYPQFLSTEPEDKDNLVDVTKRAFLADKIRIHLHIENNNPIEEKENFSHYLQLDTLKSNPFTLPRHISCLLGDRFKVRDPQTGDFLIKWLLDDRMFVISWHGNNAISKELCCSKFLEDQRTFEYNYQDNPLWHEYIFIDQDYSTCQHKEMNRTLLNAHTYGRWADYGTLFGISRYSFIIISQNNDYTRNVLPLPHLKSMYFQMIRLCLAQRASILRFSNEVTVISSFRGNPLETTELISSLTREYLKFVNKMYFREVTAQEQGIEIYDLIQEFMRIERDVKDLNREIDELYQYATILEDRVQTKKINQLNLIALLFLPITVFTGILGMNTMPEIEYLPKCLFSEVAFWPFWISIIAVIIISFGILMFFNWKMKLGLFNKRSK